MSDQGYVICPETITGPHASQEYDRMPDDEPCGLRCPVVKTAPVMHFRCPRGHSFLASESEILRQGAFS